MFFTKFDFIKQLDFKNMNKFFDIIQFLLLLKFYLKTFFYHLKTFKYYKNKVIMYYNLLFKRNLYTNNV